MNAPRDHRLRGLTKREKVAVIPEILSLPDDAIANVVNIVVANRGRFEHVFLVRELAEAGRRAAREAQFAGLNDQESRARNHTLATG